MSPDALIQAAANLPQVAALRIAAPEGLGLDPREIEARLRHRLGSVAREVGLAYQWDFAMREATNVTTVADQADYIFSGLSEDCHQVASIKRGDDEVLLTETDRPSINRRLSFETVSEAAYWLPVGRDTRGLPEIRLVATPTSGGETLKYEYWRSDLTVEEFPADCDDALVLCLGRKLVPSLTRFYRDAVTGAIRTYVKATGKVNRTALDPTLRNANIRRAGLHGWS